MTRRRSLLATAIFSSLPPAGSRSRSHSTGGSPPRTRPDLPRPEFRRPLLLAPQQGTPEVEQYLEAEKRLREAMNRPTRRPSARLSTGSARGMKHDRSLGPVRMGPFYYYHGARWKASSTRSAAEGRGPGRSLDEKGSRGSPPRPEADGQGEAFLRRRSLRGDNDECRLLFATDDTGFRQSSCTRRTENRVVEGPLADAPGAWPGGRQPNFLLWDRGLGHKRRTRCGAEAGRAREPGEGPHQGLRRKTSVRDWVYRTKDKNWWDVGASTDTWESRILDSSAPTPRFAWYCPGRRATSTTWSTTTARSSSVNQQGREELPPGERSALRPESARGVGILDHRKDVLLDDVESSATTCGPGKKEGLNHLRYAISPRGAGGRSGSPSPSTTALTRGHPGVHLATAPLHLPDLTTSRRASSTTTWARASPCCASGRGAGRLRPRAVRLRAPLGHGPRRGQRSRSASSTRRPTRADGRRRSGSTPTVLRRGDVGHLRQPPLSLLDARHSLRDRPRPGGTRWGGPGTTTGC
jgi:hypothetical protein